MATSAIVQAASASVKQVSHKIEAVCWDISLGLASTKLGKRILRATSGCPKSVPDSIDHVGIRAYGHIYEYGDCGILKTKIEDVSKVPLSKYPAFKFRAAEVIGETTKEQEEFEEWIVEMNREKYLGTKYDVVEHSCIVWAVEATEFLGVSYPENWDRLQSYAKANRMIASLVGQSIVSSRRINFEPLNRLSLEATLGAYVRARN